MGERRRDSQRVEAAAQHDDGHKVEQRPDDL